MSLSRSTSFFLSVLAPLFAIGFGAAFLNQLVFSVLVWSILTAACTGLGGIPFLFVKKFSRTWMGISNSLASGLMLSASFSMCWEGFAYNPSHTLIGCTVGGVFLVACNKWFNHDGEEASSGKGKERKDHSSDEGRRRRRRRSNDDDRSDATPVGHSNENKDKENDNGNEEDDEEKEDSVALHDAFANADTKKALLIVLVMTIHSFAEGVGVGVSFGGGEQLGAFISSAIALHNVPEGLAIALVLVPRGTSPFRAMQWSVFSSLPQAIMAVPAFLFVQTFAALLPSGLGFASGAMLWMVFSELMPDACNDLPKFVVFLLSGSIALPIMYWQIVTG